MSGNEVSLRSLIDKWLAPTAASPIHLTRMSRVKTRSQRCVHVECLGASGSLAFFFFRHVDGSWCVFPPTPERPMMQGFLKAE